MRKQAMLFWSTAIIVGVFVMTPPTLLSQKKARATAAFSVNTVADTLDANPGDGICADANGVCSLRAAIGEANAFPGPDTIMMPPGTYTQTLVAPNDDANIGGDWDITSDITIIGSGEASCAIEAATSPAMATERVLDVRSGGSLTLSRVTVRNGNFSGSMTSATRGAGIENLGVLTLDGVTVRDNQITSNNGDPYGAGIYNAGTGMTLNSASITGNTISRQVEGSVFGGGIASSSQTTISISNSFVGNSAFANSGTVFGAGLYLENRFTVNMTGTAVAGNVAGGAWGNNGGGVSAIANAGAALFNATGCTFRNNSAAGSGNGQGVGLYFLTTGVGANALTATLDGVFVKENIGTSSGVGIGATVNGGNLTLNILNSSITNNLGGVAGGGIFATDAGPPPAGLATVNLTNTTVSNNTANNGGGGLLFQGGLTSANLNHVTIAGNTADICGGICAVAAGVVNIKNSVVGDNSGGTAPDVWGVIVSGDYNHFESTAGATITGTTTHNATGDAMLGPVVEHVGGIVNMPDPTSPVVNAIPFGVNDCGTVIVTDQRGALRPQAGACDKGAVERVAFASISGRVLTTSGQGIRNAMVTLMGGNLTLVTYTGSFGWYSFPNVPGEVTYTITASARRYEIPPGTFRSVYLFRDTSGLDFIAETEP